MKRITAVYLRVSSSGQKTKSQKPDLLRWIKAQPPTTIIRKFSDQCTGKTMDRPGWNRVQKLIHANRVSQLVIWRLDRLGRTAAGLTKLFRVLQQHKCNLISLKDGLDLSTSSGRLVAHILASVAEYETEVISERIRAGQAASEKTWGGSAKGRLLKITPEQVKAIVRMKQAGERICTISKTTGVPRQSIYRILQRVSEGYLKVI